MLMISFKCFFFSLFKDLIDLRKMFLDIDARIHQQGNTRQDDIEDIEGDDDETDDFT